MIRDNWDWIKNNYSKPGQNKNMMHEARNLSLTESNNQSDARTLDAEFDAIMNGTSTDEEQLCLISPAEKQ